MFSQTSMNLSKTPSPNTSPIFGALVNNNQCMLITRKDTNSRIGEVNFFNHDEDITPLSIAHSKKSNIIATINWKSNLSSNTKLLRYSSWRCIWFQQHNLPTTQTRVSRVVFVGLKGECLFFVGIEIGQHKLILESMGLYQE